jgi:hypothetical protein
VIQTVLVDISILLFCGNSIASILSRQRERIHAKIQGKAIPCCPGKFGV